MTRGRAFGEDTPFGAWLRAQPALDSVRDGVTAHDVDMAIHKYKNPVDGLGERAIHLMMDIEVKTFGGFPDPAQLQTIWFKHQLCDKRQRLQDVYPRKSQIAVWHFGYFVLMLSGTQPDDSESITWFMFDEFGEMIRRQLTCNVLVQLLSFELNPRTLTELSLRRHHQTRKLMIREELPLGFSIDRLVTKRS